MDIAHIIRCENSFTRSFALVEQRPYGTLYHAPDNLESHDSNHALVTDLDHDLEAAIDDICGFYLRLGVRPRVYQSHAPGEQRLLVPRLAARGFEVSRTADRFLALTGSSRIRPVTGFTFRRVHELSDDVIQLVRAENDGEGGWTLGVLARQLVRDPFHLLVGYHNGRPVSMLSLELMDGLSRVDDVITHPELRRRGYGRSLVHRAAEYHRRISSNGLYLYAENPVAIRIYLEAGFEPLDWQVDRWVAWLPKSGGDTLEPPNQ